MYIFVSFCWIRQRHYLDVNLILWRNRYWFQWLMLLQIVLPKVEGSHYSGVIMNAMASQITNLTTVYSAFYSRCISKKTSKLRVTGLCEGNSPVAGDFHAHRASNAENVAIWWRHQEDSQLGRYYQYCWKPVGILTNHISLRCMGTFPESTVTIGIPGTLLKLTNHTSCYKSRLVATCHTWMSYSKYGLDWRCDGLKTFRPGAKTSDSTCWCIHVASTPRVPQIH